MIICPLYGVVYVLPKIHDIIGCLYHLCWVRDHVVNVLYMHKQRCTFMLLKWIHFIIGVAPHGHRMEWQSYLFFKMLNFCDMNNVILKGVTRCFIKWPAHAAGNAAKCRMSNDVSCLKRVCMLWVLLYSFMILESSTFIYWYVNRWHGIVTNVDICPLTTFPIFVYLLRFSVCLLYNICICNGILMVYLSLALKP